MSLLAVAALVGAVIKVDLRNNMIDSSNKYSGVTSGVASYRTRKRLLSNVRRAAASRASTSAKVGRRSGSCSQHSSVS